MLHDAISALSGAHGTDSACHAELGCPHPPALPGRADRDNQGTRRAARLRKQGQVLGTTRLNIRFDNEDEPVSIRPHLVRVLEAPGERR